MGIFDKKPKAPEYCDVCGVEFDGAGGRTQVADGVICMNCMVGTWSLHGSGNIGDYSVGILKAEIEREKGGSIENEPAKTVAPELLSNEQPSIKCPKCRSTQISADKKGFGVGKAVVGAAVAGPIGLVVGNIGAKKVVVTCLKCGHQWKAGKS